MKWRDHIRDFEWHLLLVALVLTALGVAFIWSAAQSAAYISGKPYRQLLYLAVCIPMMGVILKAGYPILARYAYGLYVLLIAMLILVLLVNRGGAARWFSLGFGFRLQPSEFMKLGLIIALSRYLTFPRNMKKWRGMLPPILMAGLPMILIVKQPDLGTALIFIPVTLGLLYVAGVSTPRLVLLVSLGALCLPLIYFLPLLKDYQKERVRTFLVSIPKLHEEAHKLKKEGKRDEAAEIEAKLKLVKQGAGFQNFHAMVAVGSGGLTGKGLAKGPQNRLNTLPARHTDFIFAIVGEEWGFLGCSVILLLFFLMVAIILGVARRTRDPFGRYLCAGMGLLFITQVFLNTAISVGLLPVTGLTLPFVSYGGSSLLTSYIALGLVLDVGRRRVRVLGPSP